MGLSTQHSRTLSARVALRRLGIAGRSHAAALTTIMRYAETVTDLNLTLPHRIKSFVVRPNGIL
jgi:hypothetical protein